MMATTEELVKLKPTRWIGGYNVGWTADLMAQINWLYNFSIKFVDDYCQGSSSGFILISRTAIWNVKCWVTSV